MVEYSSLLFNLSPGAAISSNYGRGILVATVSAIMVERKTGFDDALLAILPYLPAEIDERCIPPGRWQNLLDLREEYSFHVDLFRDAVDEYETNKYGAITNPGKFEGEAVYAPYFHSLSLLGAETDILFDPRGNDVHVFKLSRFDKAVFADLKKWDWDYVCLEEDTQGFVYCFPATQKQFAVLEEDYEELQDEQDE